MDLHAKAFLKGLRDAFLIGAILMAAYFANNAYDRLPLGDSPSAASAATSSGAPTSTSTAQR
jgi:hypothetical protein